MLLRLKQRLHVHSQRYPPTCHAARPLARRFPGHCRAMATAVEVVVSPLDERRYRHISLPNKLQVLLIHDAATEKSAAAMDVNVGHFSDPEEVAGLAHFCEHMLFLGTEKYPDEAGYNQYLGQHGGMSNAYTSMENTNYYFDVQQEHFEGALDRFAQFFLTPLFTPDATARELKAIESENSKNLQNDMWRSFQLEKSLSSSIHPFHKFGTGNTETLVDMPQKNGVDIRDELLKFHKQYYSANLMKLVVLGRESLDELEAMATRMFSEIPNIDAPVPTFEGTPYGEEQRGRTVKTVPIKEMRVLKMAWPLPPQKAHYRTKATRYFGHLIGHEGKGSILALLKKEGWADSLSAGEGSAGSDFSCFHVAIELTEEGLRQVQQVAAVVFQYIGMLQREGVSEFVWKEEQAVAAMSFRFQEKSEPINAVTRFAGWMQDYPPEETFTGAYLFSEFDAALIQAVQDSLTPQGCMITVASKELEPETDAEERWYSTKYAAAPTSEEATQHYQAQMAVEHSELHLPAKNKFIATDFELKPTPPVCHEHPTLLEDTPLLQLWHKQDTVFKKPKGIVFVDLSTPLAYDSPANTVLTRLFSAMIKDGLNEFAYDAEVAGLHYEVLNTTQGMQIQLSGYNDKLLTLLEAVCAKVAGFEGWAEEQRFALLKEQTRRAYKNFFLNQAYQTARYAQSQLLTQKQWHIRETLEVIEGELSLEGHLQPFARSLLSQLRVTMLVGGNLCADDARSAGRAVTTTLSTEKIAALAPSQIPYERAVALQPGGNLVHQLPVQNEKEDNGAVVMYHLRVMIIATRTMD